MSESSPIDEDRMALAFFQRVVWMSYLTNNDWVPSAVEEAESLRKIYFDRLDKAER